MDIIPREQYTVFRYATKGWTLCVIDDDWQYPHMMFSMMPNPLSAADQEAWQVRVANAWQRASYMALSLLPVFCAELPELKELVLMGFPSSKSDASYLAEILERAEGDTAFLIDLNDSATDLNLGEDIALPMIRRAGIPITHVAFLTVGGAARTKELPILDKGPLERERGASLRLWWAAVQGAITPKFFDQRTTAMPEWHDPDNLDWALVDETFREFVQLQAQFEKYGVWRWVDSMLHSRAPLADKKYAYLCGKAFLKSANLVSFPFTALRGLTMGLGYALPQARELSVEEDPPGLPRAFVEDVNSTHCLGTCRVPAGDFQAFARSLRRWLLLVESAKNGAARLARARLCRPANPWELCELRLQFTAELPQVIFEGTGRGLVTQGWAELLRGFEGGRKPIVEDEGRSIRLIFDCE